MRPVNRNFKLIKTENPEQEILFSSSQVCPALLDLSIAKLNMLVSCEVTQSTVSACVLVHHPLPPGTRTIIHTRRLFYYHFYYYLNLEFLFTKRNIGQFLQCLRGSFIAE